MWCEEEAAKFCWLLPAVGAVHSSPSPSDCPVGQSLCLWSEVCAWLTQSHFKQQNLMQPCCSPRNITATFRSPQSCYWYFCSLCSSVEALCCYMIYSYWLHIELYLMAALCLYGAEQILNLTSMSLWTFSNHQDYDLYSGLNQMMDIITSDKITFHPLSSHCGYCKTHLSPLATQSVSKFCCTSNAAYMKGPVLVLVPSLAVKVKVVWIPDYQGYCALLWWEMSPLPPT